MYEFIAILIISDRVFFNMKGYQKIIVSIIVMGLLIGLTSGSQAFAQYGYPTSNNNYPSASYPTVNGSKGQNYHGYANTMPPSPSCVQAQTSVTAGVDDATLQKQYQNLKSQSYSKWQSLTLTKGYNGTYGIFFKEKFSNSSDVIKLRLMHEESIGLAKYCYGPMPGMGQGVIPTSSGEIKSAGTAAVTNNTLQEIEPVAKVPMWVKNNAKWWANGQISDSDFLMGIQYLASQNMINLAPGLSPSGTNATPDIPFWVKGISQMWADGKMSNADFINSIQFLADQGSINTNSK